jgi:hypothetical protein
MDNPSKFNHDKFLKVSVATAVLLVGLSVAYYFAFALPQQKQAELDFQKQQYQEKQQAAAQQASAQAEQDSSAAAASVYRSTMLSACLSDAQTSYDNNWASGCASQLANFQSEMNSCTAGVYCQTLWAANIEESKGKSCTLLGGRADGVNQALKDQKNDCYRQYGN